MRRASRSKKTTGSKDEARELPALKRFHYDTHDELRSHLADFVSAYNFAKRLKTLKGLTPYEYIRRAWTKEPERFTLNPLQQMPGLNI